MSVFVCVCVCLCVSRWLGACTAASQQEGHGFDSRMGRSWLWGAGPPQSAQCSGGLSPGPFCVEFACSPRVHKGFPPLRTPTEKTCKITEHMSIHDQRWPVHCTWSPGATSCPLLLEDPGGGTIRDGLKAEVEFTATSGLRVCVCACVCVCVCVRFSVGVFFFFLSVRAL